MPPSLRYKTTVDARSCGRTGRAKQLNHPHAYCRPGRSSGPYRTWQYRVSGGAAGAAGRGGAKCSEPKPGFEAAVPPEMQADAESSRGSEAQEPVAVAEGLAAASSPSVNPLQQALHPSAGRPSSPSRAPPGSASPVAVAADLTPVQAAQAAERRPPQHAAEQLVRGVGSILAHMAAKAPTDTQLTCFHSSYAPKISIQNYIARILRNFMCSNQCLVLALIYIDRLVQNTPTIAVSELSCHRLFITAAMLAAKFHDDHFFSNAHYAKVGGLSPRELSGLEKRFLYYANWRVHVQPEEYELYCDLVGQALSGAKDGGKAAAEAPNMHPELRAACEAVEPVHGTGGAAVAAQPAEGERAARSPPGA